MTRSLAFSSKAGAAAATAATATDSATSFRTSLLPTAAAPGITGTQLFTFQKPPYERYVIPTYSFLHHWNQQVVGGGDADVAAATSSVDMVPPLPIRETTELDSTQQEELQRHWTALWQKIHAIGPIKPSVGLASLDCLSCSGLVFVWYIVVTTWVDTGLQNDHSFVVYLLALVALQTMVAACRNHAKMRRFEALTALCNNSTSSSEHGITTGNDGSANGADGTEVQALRRLGYGVEYQHTGMASTPEYLYLYTIPIVPPTSAHPNLPFGQGAEGPGQTDDNQDMATLTQFVQRNGYLRLETFNTSKSYRNPVLLSQASLLLSSLPHVPEFKRLEYGHHRVWINFWLDQYQALEQRQATHDFFLFVVWIYPIFVALLIWGLLTDNVIMIALAVMGKLVFCFAACAHVSSSKRHLNKTAQVQLQDDLARCGYYWESRTVYDYSKRSVWLLLLSGTPHYIHYFYLFSTMSISAEAATAASASVTTETITKAAIPCYAATATDIC